jgi:hypothetical protein
MSNNLLKIVFISFLISAGSVEGSKDELFQLFAEGVRLP